MAIDIGLTYVHYEYNYRNMIGDKIFTPHEAYKVFHNFLKEINALGYFKDCMIKRYSVASQLYSKFFETKVQIIKRNIDILNKIHKNKCNYSWYIDRTLLFPFAHNWETHSCDLSTYWKTIYELWMEYCSDNKIFHSEINVTNCGEPTTETCKLLVIYNFFRE
jgi:hypothetical protein